MTTVVDTVKKHWLLALAAVAVVWWFYSRSKSAG